jgi:peptidoglycan/LPS O-acetylase OafA/YrhL
MRKLISLDKTAQMSTRSASTAGFDRSDSFIPALDGLRALAILLVIPHNSDTFGAHPGIFLPLAVIAHAGWIGVQLFFVLSGFLITRNLLELRSSANYFGVFFGRRILRIFPLYFLTLIVGLLVLPQLLEFSPKQLASQTHQVWLWTFVSNWAQPFGKVVAGYSHFWSLAVEEQFYLIWPAVVLACVVTRLRIVCVALIVAAFLFRLACVYHDVRPEVPYMFTVSRMDALAFGALVATLTNGVDVSHWPRSRYDLLIYLACATLAVAGLFTHVFSTYDPITLTLGHTVLGAAFATIIWVIVHFHRTGYRHWLLSALSVRPLRSVGRYSFAMYVFHLPLAIAIGHWLSKIAPSTNVAYPVLQIVVIIACTYLAGFASYHLLEKHFLALKKHLVAKQANEAQPDRVQP